MSFRIRTYKKTGGGGAHLSPSKLRLTLSLVLVHLVGLLILPAMSLAQQSNKSPQLGSSPGISSKGELGRIEVYESSEELHETLQEKPPITFAATRLPNLTISVNEAVKYQQIDGFGASLTDSSAWLISQKLSETQRREFLEMLFDAKKGIGLKILRQPMGASDFALEPYSYDDMPQGQEDPQLKHFSIDHDKAYIIPILREALAINPDLKIMGSPWSPPGWMKTSGSMIQGTLLPAAYSPLAKYFVQYVRAYEAAGVPIYAVTMQNEPLNIPGDYPGMGMSASEQAKFLGENLGPTFRAAGIKSKILAFDHNWDLIAFPIEVMSDLKAAKFAGGIAIHCYGGTVTAQSELHDRFPDKGIWLTECSGGEWQKGDLLAQTMELVIGATRNWAKSVVLWNLVLDQNHQPFLGGCKTCRGVVTIDHSVSPAKIVPNEDFTALAHASKFLAPGAVRIESNTFGLGSLQSVAFGNPDGSLVLIVMNTGSAATTFNVGWRKKYATYRLDPNAIATFRWQPPARVH